MGKLNGVTGRQEEEGGEKTRPFIPARSAAAHKVAFKSVGVVG